MNRDDIIRMAKEAGAEYDQGSGAMLTEDMDVFEFAALVAAAGLVSYAAERAPAPLIFDASKVDKEVLINAMALHRPVLLAGEPATRRDRIEAVVHDRLTADKADHICERDGYGVTGVILTDDTGRACLVNQSAVRWLPGVRDLWNLMHTDSLDNVRMVDEAVAAEREACAKVVDANADACGEAGGLRDILRSNSAAIRARGRQ